MGMEMILLLALAVGPSCAGGDVTYDGRSLIINGTRRILFSGSIHYPRSTPQMWPGLISKAKQGGIDVIQTYVFWNVHEPVQGQFNFHDRYDLVGFIKEVQKQGLYASLRIGPFIQAEWRYGGFPFWLHDVPGIVFRSDNDLFKYYMKRYASKIVSMMKAEGLYASQGGPIILSQIENEYKTVEAAFHEKGPPYVRWAASMVVGLKTGVPWMMCKQDDAPDPVINACNGMRCGETFVGPNSPTKPAIWTENWTSFIQVYGSEPYIRSAEDIAFTVALFIAAMNGSFVNYYMYHGGTNFGRSAASYMITAYYDQAPLDEYGLIRQPKWGHLRELHAAIKGCSETLLHGSYSELSLGKLQEGHVFQDKSGKCVAFIVNKDRNVNANVQFHNTTYWLPARSISILPDCKNTVFNTAKVSTQHGIRSTSIARNLVHGWEAFRDEISNYEKASFSANALLDHMNVTKDETDYLWYSISYESTPGNYEHTLHVVSRAHVVHAFVNDDYLGSSHGNSKTRNTVFENSISLKDGRYDIALLSVMVGSPDSGAYLEHRATGLRRVIIQSSSNGSQDISNHQWGYKTWYQSPAPYPGLNILSNTSIGIFSGFFHFARTSPCIDFVVFAPHRTLQIGLLGEKLKIYTQEGLNNVVWGTIKSSMHQSLTWYKTTFDAPTGSNPVAINLASMGKGEAWINGKSIGRYWVSFKTPIRQPSQTLYHIPSSFMKPSGNLLVLFEEMGGNPHHITLETISISSICGIVSDSQPPSLFSRRGRPSVKLECHGGRTISAINFASYGTPIGDCGQYAIGSCHSSTSKAVVEKACLGKKRCSVDISIEQFGKDPCPKVSKSLLVAASCH